MSVIVWDGKTLAADKQATNAGLVHVCSKIFRIGENLVGFVGDYDYLWGMKHWMETGANPDDFPAHQKDKDTWVGTFVVTPDGRLLKYERCPYPADFSQNKIMCMGSGRDFAYGALEMGADAVRAVEIASKYESTCGMGVDTLTFGGV